MPASALTVRLSRAKRGLRTYLPRDYHTLGSLFVETLKFVHRICGCVVGFSTKPLKKASILVKLQKNLLHKRKFGARTQALVFAASDSLAGCLTTQETSAAVEAARMIAKAADQESKSTTVMDIS